MATASKEAIRSHLARCGATLALLLVALCGGGCALFSKSHSQRPLTPATGGDREAIMALVAQRVAYTSIRYVNFNEGATHAVVGLYASPKGGGYQAPSASPTNQAVVELDKINGRWFIMSVNGWGT